MAGTTPVTLRLGALAGHQPQWSPLPSQAEPSLVVHGCRSIGDGRLATCAARSRIEACDEPGLALRLPGRELLGVRDCHLPVVFVDGVDECPQEGDRGAEAVRVLVPGFELGFSGSSRRVRFRTCGGQDLDQAVGGPAIPAVEPAEDAAGLISG